MQAPAHPAPFAPATALGPFAALPQLSPADGGAGAGAGAGTGAGGGTSPALTPMSSGVTNAPNGIIRGECVVAPAPAFCFGGVCVITPGL
jgi:hypothetical protein